MKLSEKLTLLGDVGIIDWLEAGKSDEQVRVLVNALGNYLLGEDNDWFEFTPSCDEDAVYHHFVDSGYDYDWLRLITFEFIESVDMGYVLNYINFPRSQPYYTEQEMKAFIIDWLEKWCSNCREAFFKALQENVDRSNELHDEYGDGKHL